MVAVVESVATLLLLVAGSGDATALDVVDQSPGRHPANLAHFGGGQPGLVDDGELLFEQVEAAVDGLQLEQDRVRNGVGEHGALGSSRSLLHFHPNRNGSACNLIRTAQLLSAAMARRRSSAWMYRW